MSTTIKQTKFTVTALGMGAYSAYVYGKLGRRLVTVRFMTVNREDYSSSNPLQYCDTLDKISGDKVEDITEDQQKECQKHLDREVKAKARSLRRFEKLHFGRKG